MFHIGNAYQRIKVITTIVAAITIFLLEAYFLFTHETYIVREIELASMIVVLVIMTLYGFKKFNTETTFILVAYAAFINITVTTPGDIANSDNAFVTNLIYLFILLSLIGFIGSKYHVIIAAVAINLYFLWCIIYSNSDYLLKNYAANSVVIMIYSFTVFLIKGLIEKAIVIHDKMFKEITEQKEELETQTQHLIEANSIILDQKEQVERMNTTKDKLFSIIAHDIMEPVSNIQGFSELLQVKEIDISEEERNIYVKKIFQSSINLFDMMDGLLNWSKSQLDSFTFNPQKSELSSIYKRVLDYFSELLNNKNITYKATACEHICIWADVNMVEIIFRNLIVNAIKFSHQGGVIQINIKVQENYVITEIVDNGIGMDKQTVKRLLNPYDYYTSKGTQKEKGHGLGIKLVMEMIEQNKGTFNIQSTEGVGSVISFGLPIYKES